VSIGLFLLWRVGVAGEAVTPKEGSRRRPHTKEGVITRRQRYFGENNPALPTFRSRHEVLAT
jgi:hypothetical protein